MGYKTTLAVFALLSATCCAAQEASKQTAQSEPSYTINISTANGPIRLASPIGVAVVVTNIRDKDIYWKSDRGSNSAYKDFHVLLVKDGHEVETTFFNRKITGRQRNSDPDEVESSSSISLSYPPGVIFSFNLDLKRLYEITEPGVYTLTLSRTDEFGKNLVQSNPATLHVVP